MKKLFIFLLIPLILSACSSRVKKPVIEKYFDLSKQYYIEDSLKRNALARLHFINSLIKSGLGETAEAILECMESAKLKESPLVYYQLALLYYSYGRIPNAFQYIAEAMKQDPNYLRAIDLLYRLYYNEMNIKEAAKMLEWKLEVLPSFNHKKRVADFCLSLGPAERAETLYLELLEENELIDDTGLYLNLFETYGYLENSERINEIANLLKDRKHYIYKNKVYASLIFYYLRMLLPDELSLILSELDSGFKKWEVTELMEYTIGMLYWRFSPLSENSDPIEDIIKVVLEHSDKINSYNTITYYYLGAIADYVADSIRAEKHFNRYLYLNGTNKNAFQEAFDYFHLKNNLDTLLPNMLNYNLSYEEESLYPLLTGVIYCELDSIEQSKNYFQKAIKIDSNNVEKIVGFGLLSDDKKKYKESDFYYNMLLEIEPENELVLNNYAYSLAERGIFLEKAFEMIKKSIDKDSAESHYLDTYGWVYFKLGDNEKALYYLEKSAALDSTNFIVWLHIGDVLKAQGKDIEAIAAWEEGLKLEPENIDLLDRIRNK